MKQSKVAIYMSCYNHEKYVADAVNSILNQTYPNLELYMVNDSSTDETGNILEQFKDERIHYFDFKENTKFAGASAFLQKLIKNSDADYVACMASDDMWREDKLEKQICFLTEHPEYKACFTWHKIIFSAERNEYRYSTLFDLFAMTRGYEEGDGQFRRIKQKMEELRDRRRGDGGRQRVLFIIAEREKPLKIWYLKGLDV